MAHENAPASVKGPSSVQSTPVVAPEVPSAALRRSRRSASPKKQAAARAPRAPSSKAGSTSGRGRKKKGSVVDDESIASTSPAVPHVVPEELLVRAEGAVEKADAEDGKPILDTIKVDVRSRSSSLFSPGCLMGCIAKRHNRIISSGKGPSRSCKGRREICPSYNSSKTRT